jgi:hypothetical protein
MCAGKVVIKSAASGAAALVGYPAVSGLAFIFVYKQNIIPKPLLALISFL